MSDQMARCRTAHLNQLLALKNYIFYLYSKEKQIILDLTNRNFNPFKTMVQQKKSVYDWQTTEK